MWSFQFYMIQYLERVRVWMERRARKIHLPLQTIGTLSICKATHKSKELSISLFNVRLCEYMLCGIRWGYFKYLNNLTSLNTVQDIILIPALVANRPCVEYLLRYTIYCSVRYTFFWLSAALKASVKSGSEHAWDFLIIYLIFVCFSLTHTGSLRDWNVYYLWR